jgi:hypothetical protein
MFQNDEDFTNYRRFLCRVMENPEIIITETKYNNDEQIILECIKKNGLLLEFASDDLKNNKDLVKEAIENNKDAFKFIGSDLKNDINFLKEIIHLDIDLEYIPEKTKNKDFYNMYIKYDHNNYLKIPLEFKKNIDILIPLSNNLHFFEDFSPYFNDDYDVFLQLVDFNGLLLEFASPKLKNNYNIAYKAIQNNPSAVEFISEELQDNFTLISKAVEMESGMLEYGSPNLRNQISIVMKAVKKQGSTLRFASDNLKNNFEIVMEAIKDDPYSYMYASEDLKNNKLICMEVIKNDISIIEDYNPNILEKEEILIEMILLDPYNIEYVNDNQMNVIMKSLEIGDNSKLYSILSSELQNNYQIIQKMKKFKNENIFEYITDPMLMKYKDSGHDIFFNFLSCVIGNGIDFLIFSKNYDIFLIFDVNTKNKFSQENDFGNKKFKFL